MSLQNQAKQRIASALKKHSESLALKGLKLRELPGEIGQLQRLRALSLGNNDLHHLTPEIGKLKMLESLGVEANRLVDLPPEIGDLSNLKSLLLYSNSLSTVPAEVGKLQNLRMLGLSSNLIAEFPVGLLQLASLQHLRLSGNRLSSLPHEIGNLRGLRHLRVTTNKLCALPAAIGNLSHLERLHLRGNLLPTLPPEIGSLVELVELDLRGNPLTTLPVELGNCRKLKTIALSEPARLRFPPGDVAELGTGAILRYLQAAGIGTETVWESKLLLVGEGAVGKTWLYEAMNGRRSGGARRGDGATVGIEIGPLSLPHPDDAGVTMRLNCWDFAGQDINHATHQFFFSERTIFLLCWSARAGWEAGKLRKWLTNIRDRAPGAKVLLVGTHSDQPHSDYPEKELREEFRQILGTFMVSSETGDGVPGLLMEIGRQAKDLPMMGLRWPRAWRAAERAVKQSAATGPYASLKEVSGLIRGCGLDSNDATVILRWLHELGEILHYADVPELAELVMLDPQWVTRRVGEVLASADVQSAKGILTKACLDSIWPDLEAHVRQHLLGMMERFDLAYRIPEDQEHRCLVVERLPQNPPDYEKSWASAKTQPEVRLRYRLRAMHPGIPTWFIARCHRFTLGLHWLRGVLFGDHRHTPRHLALVAAKESERVVDFTVRGPQPWTFLPLLTDGFEDTVLKRYPGLEFDRIAPCSGRRKDGKPCDYEFNVKDLEALRWPEERGVDPEYGIRCPRCRTEHDIDELLLGLSRAPSRDAEKLQEILAAVHAEGEMTRTDFSKEMEETRRFIQLAFVQEWNQSQELEEQSCPTVFALYPVGGKAITRKSKLRLQLYCMDPFCWHSIGDDGVCEFQPWRDGLVTAVRWIRSGLRWLRPAAALLPSGSQLAGEYAKNLHEFAARATNELKFTADLFKELRDVPTLDPDSSATFEKDMLPTNRSERVEIHELKEFLDQLRFPVKPYGGLRRVRTPEGHVLWLCAKHAGEFSQVSAADATALPE
ncbi:MAG TPA: COR domain-containing protein [Verrucomicrobiae bacterium]|nr:COR domain-containing protein [Verrucomicrobiae bacterium]